MKHFVKQDFSGRHSEQYRKRNGIHPLNELRGVLPLFVVKLTMELTNFLR